MAGLAKNGCHVKDGNLEQIPQKHTSGGFFYAEKEEVMGIVHKNKVQIL